MNSVEEIERAVGKLSADDFARLRDWIIEQDERSWDDQLKHDISADKLSFLIREAQAEREQGRLKPMDEIQHDS